MSGAIWRTPTVVAPSDSSSVFENTTVLRRYGSDPGLDPVVAEFAMFSAITRRRVV
jgi:hypothetical protein